MSHIATHPPGDEDTFFSNSPVVKMFGYLTIKGADGKKLKVLFFNNTGHTFKKNTPVGCHLQLIPLHRAAIKRKKYCAIAYDLEDYSAHEHAEEKVVKALVKTKTITGAKLRLEDLSVASIESYLQQNPVAEEGEQRILRETCAYMQTDSFRQIYYDKTTAKNGASATRRPNIEHWLVDNVVDIEDTKTLIFGCGKPDGSEMVEIPEFKKLMNQYFKKPASATTPKKKLTSARKTTKKKSAAKPKGKKSKT